MGSNRAWRCEILLNNFIDKDFQAALLPFNLVQLLFLVPKYYIRDNFITPNGTITNLVICFGSVFVCLFNIYRLVVTLENPDYNLFIFVSKLLSIISFTYGSLWNAFITVFYSIFCVEMILKLYKSYRLLSCDNKLLKRILHWNWINVGSLISFYVVLTIHLIALHKFLPVIDMLSIWTIFIFDFNLLFGSGVLRIIRVNLYLWICQIRRKGAPGQNDNNMDHFYWQQMYTIYEELLDAYNLYKKIFKAMILFHTYENFFHCLFLVLTYTWIFQFWKVDGNTLLISVISGAMWIPKNLLIQFILGVQCEKLYDVIKQTQLQCALNMKLECSVHERRAYKNVLRTCQTSFSKFSVYGLFQVDAALPLRTLSLLAAYIVAILQFTLTSSHN